MRKFRVFELILKVVTLVVPRVVPTCDNPELPPIRYMGDPREIYLA